jgi:hypothetical protein
MLKQVLVLNLYFYLRYTWDREGEKEESIKKSVLKQPKIE